PIATRKARRSCPSTRSSPPTSSTLSPRSTAASLGSGERLEWMTAAAREHVPTVLRIGPYRLFFYSSDRIEPPHVHAERDDNVAKFWLNPVRLHHAVGFRAAELRRIQRIVEDHQAELLEAWHEFFNR